MHMPFFVAHCECPFVDRNAGGTRQIARPERSTRSDIETGNPPLEGRRTEIVPGKNRHTRHIGDPLDRTMQVAPLACRSHYEKVTGYFDVATSQGARAITDYRTLDHAARKLAWLELQPLTGRTHQLRVHCVALRAPILGDTKYHQPDQNNAFSAQIEGLSDRLHLHARALRLPHPAGGHLLVEADLPPHMQETFRTLGFHARPARKPQRVTG